MKPLMSILSAVVRARPEHLAAVLERMASLPGVDVALNPGDGRLVLVMEDAVVGGTVRGAATTLAAVALWPDVLNTSLVYEYSGPDAPSGDDNGVTDYRDWRGSLAQKHPEKTSPESERTEKTHE